MLEAPSAGFDEMLADHRPNIVAVYEDDFNFLSKMCLTRMREVAWEMAKAARAIGAVTIVHGSDSTDNPALFLQNGFDYVLCGEAEETLVRLCTSILHAEGIPEIDGLVRLDEHGQAVRSSQRLSKNPAWSELTFPARDLIDMEPYRAAWLKLTDISQQTWSPAAGVRIDATGAQNQSPATNFICGLPRLSRRR